MMRRSHAIWLLLGPLWLSGSAIAKTAADPATQSAVSLLQRCLRLHDDGQHNDLLRSLRHLRDPFLEPFFDQLAASDHPALKIHGILGLAEIDPSGLDIQRFAQIDQPMVQGELIGAALDDGGLLTDEQARMVVRWPGLDSGVMLLVATRLIGRGMLDNQELLTPALRTGNRGRRGLAALLLSQLADPAGTAALAELNHDPDPQTNAVRAMLLQTAQTHELTTVAPWAYEIATEPQVEKRLSLLALRVSLGLKDPRAAALWSTRYTEATELAQRIRLALVALEHAAHIPPEIFGPLQEHGDPLLHRIAVAGIAVAMQTPDLADPIRDLVSLRHHPANSWALGFARGTAAGAAGLHILLALVHAGEPGSERSPHDHRRLNVAALASQFLHEQDPKYAKRAMGPLLADLQTKPLLAQAILLGLVRSQKPDAADIIAPINEFPYGATRALAILLRAKQDHPLAPPELEKLAWVVRGGGSLQNTLRIQAAWRYLKHSGQAGPALTKVLLR